MGTFKNLGILNLFCLLLLTFYPWSNKSFAQKTYIPPNYSSLPTTHNFIRSYTVLKPGLTPQQVTDTTRSPVEIQLTTAYFDGLGRTIQTVNRKGSLNTAAPFTVAQDVVQPQVYDSFGREQFQYLPYVAPGTANGSFKGTTGTNPINPFQQQKDFYNNIYVNSPIAGQGDSFYYAKTIFEPSPLNRVTEQFAPGNSWVGSEKSIIRQSVKMAYHFNALADSVRIWNVIDSLPLGKFGSYGSSGIYPAGQLYKTITTDEHGKQVIEFKDKSGQVILKKVQLTTGNDSGAGIGHNGWICTYYLYDDFGSLRCVVQPEGVKWLMQNSWNFGATNGVTILAEQCFRYEYDARNRMIMKKVPGAGEVSMVYDARDRLVYTQDSMRRVAREWIYTWYDGINRPDTTGIIKLTTETGTAFARRNAMATLMQDKINSSYPAGNVTSNTILTLTYYDDYSKLGNAPSPGHGLTSVIVIEPIDGFSAENGTDYPYARALVQSQQTKGLPTITRTRILGTANFITALTIYDAEGSAIQVKSYNPDGQITDIITTQYGFAGQVMRTMHRQQLAQTNPQTLITVTEQKFDAIGRLEKTEKRHGHVYGASLTPALSDPKTISLVAYDALGQVQKKKIGIVAGQPALLDSSTYEYNIRGWLLGTNRSFVTNQNLGAPGPGQWFGFDLGYDKQQNSSGNNYDTRQYNGNISGQSWRSAGDNIARQYEYTYDAANRLMKADFVQNKGSWGKSLNFDSYMGTGNSNDPNSAYDLNGNIKRMQQWGWTPQNAVAQIDSLTYSYLSNSTANQTFSNKLKAVNDSKTISGLGDFENRYAGAVDDYAYDGNGNLLRDLNKRMGVNTTNAIAYNYLNLPDSIKVYATNGALKGTIYYLYDATGNKISKKTVEIGVTIGATTGITLTTTTSYRGEVVYESKEYSSVPAGYASYTHQLQFFSHEEGRARVIRATPQSTAPVSFVYDYMLKDHLGNVRMVLTEQKETTLYTTLTFQGNLGSAEANNQNQIWEKANGQPIDINGVNTGSPMTLQTGSLFPVPLDSSILVRSSSGKVGAGKLLKVMAGDRIHTSVQYYYPPIGAQPVAKGLNTLLGGLASVISNSAGSGGLLKTASSTLAQGVGLDPLALSFFNNQNSSSSPDKPKAYLNVLFFDEQFNMVTGASKYQQVGTGTMDPKNPGQIGFTLGSAALAQKSGYCYIYISNESNDFVYFDNFTLSHEKSSLIEETHYYPFGLTMAGISSKAAGKLENKNEKFQGQPLDDDLGLNWYGFKWRNHDPQIGRFVEIDPLSETYPYNSTFAFSENRVTSSVEIEGLEAKDLYDELGPVRDLRAKNGMPKSDTKFEKFMDGVLIGVATLIGGAMGEIIPVLGTVVSVGTKAAKSEEVPIKLPEKAESLQKAEAGKELTKAGKEPVKSLKQPQDGVFIATKDGVVLPKGAKIPDKLEENPFRSANYGTIENGKFVEKLRIDPATPSGMKGPNFSHYHLNGSSKHLFENWPWY